jgi:hypothetical protein
MMGFAHDMMLAEIRRQPTHCNEPVPCPMRDEQTGKCCYSGMENACPLVKAEEARAALRDARAAERDEDPFLQRIMEKHGLDLRGIN